MQKDFQKCKSGQFLKSSERSKTLNRASSNHSSIQASADVSQKSHGQKKVKKIQQLPKNIQTQYYSDKNLENLKEGLQRLSIQRKEKKLKKKQSYQIDEYSQHLKKKSETIDQDEENMMIEETQRDVSIFQEQPQYKISILENKKFHNNKESSDRNIHSIGQTQLLGISQSLDDDSSILQNDSKQLSLKAQKHCDFSRNEKVNCKSKGDLLKQDLQSQDIRTILEEQRQNLDLQDVQTLERDDYQSHQQNSLKQKEFSNVSNFQEHQQIKIDQTLNSKSYQAQSFRQEIQNISKKELQSNENSKEKDDFYQQNYIEQNTFRNEKQSQEINKNAMSKITEDSRRVSSYCRRLDHIPNDLNTSSNYQNGNSTLNLDQNVQQTQQDYNLSNVFDQNQYLQKNVPEIHVSQERQQSCYKNAIQVTENQHRDFSRETERKQWLQQDKQITKSSYSYITKNCSNNYYGGFNKGKCQYELDKTNDTSNILSSSLPSNIIDQHINVIDQSNQDSSSNPYKIERRQYSKNISNHHDQYQVKNALSIEFNMSQQTTIASAPQDTYVTGRFQKTARSSEAIHYSRFNDLRKSEFIDRNRDQIENQLIKQSNTVNLSKIQSPRINNHNPEQDKLAKIYRKYQNYNFNFNNEQSTINQSPEMKSEPVIHANSFQNTQQSLKQPMVGVLMMQKDKIQRQLEEEQDRCRQLQKDNLQMRSKIQNMEDEIHRGKLNVESQSSNYQNEVSNLKQSLQLMEERVQQLRDSKQVLRQRLEEQQNMVQQVKEQRDRFQEEAKKWIRETQLFREDVQYLTDQANQLLDELQNENIQVKNLQQRLQDQEQKIESERVSRQRIQDEKERFIKRERDEQENERNEMCFQIHQLKEHISAVEREKTKWKAEAELIRDKFNKEQEALANYKNQVDKLSIYQRDSDEQKKEIQKLQEKNKIQENTMGNLRKTVEDLILQKSSLQSVLEEQLQGSLQTKQNQQIQQNQIEKLQSDIENYKRSLSEMTDLNTRLREKVDEQIVQRAYVLNEKEQNDLRNSSNDRAHLMNETFKSEYYKRQQLSNPLAQLNRLADPKNDIQRNYQDQKALETKNMGFSPQSIIQSEQFCLQDFQSIRKILQPSSQYQPQSEYNQIQEYQERAKTIQQNLQTQNNAAFSIDTTQINDIPVLSHKNNEHLSIFNSQRFGYLSDIPYQATSDLKEPESNQDYYYQRKINDQNKNDYVRKALHNNQQSFKEDDHLQNKQIQLLNNNFVDLSLLNQKGIHFKPETNERKLSGIDQRKKQVFDYLSKQGNDLVEITKNQEHSMFFTLANADELNLNQIQNELNNSSMQTVRNNLNYNDNIDKSSNLNNVSEKSQIQSLVNKSSSSINLEKLIKQKYEEKSLERKLKEGKSDVALQENKEDLDFWKLNQNKKQDIQKKPELQKVEKKNHQTQLNDLSIINIKTEQSTNKMEEHTKASQLVKESLGDLKMRLQKMREERQKHANIGSQLQNELKEHEKRTLEFEDRQSIYSKKY